MNCAEQCASLEHINWASDALLHDLAVWYHLAWMGETVRMSDTRVAALSRQSCGFSPAQRRQLLELIGELLAGIIPRYRRLQESGQCELSVTPYAHPILPLMFDFKAARDSVPDSALAAARQLSWRDARARWHVAESIHSYQEYFGTKPRGCWPAEGAVNEPTLRLLDAHGFKWAASGAAVLRRALGVNHLNPDATDAYNRPYQLPGTGLNCFFREEGLSDLIGFTYSTWHGDDAANNLVNDLALMSQGRKHRGPDACRTHCAGWRERLGVLPIQRLLVPEGHVRQSREPSADRTDDPSPSAWSAASSRSRCSSCRPAAGCRNARHLDR